MTSNVVILGDDVLRAKLKALQARTSGMAIASALLAGGIIIQTGARRRAPVKTGNLRRSIHAEIVDRDLNEATVRVGTDVEYAPHQEFGTRTGVPPHPYLRPAIDEDWGLAERTIKGALVRIIEVAG